MRKGFFSLYCNNLSRNSIVRWFNIFDGNILLRGWGWEEIDKHIPGMEITGGGKSLAKVPSMGVWIFSGTTR